MRHEGKSTTLPGFKAAGERKSTRRRHSPWTRFPRKGERVAANSGRESGRAESPHDSLSLSFSLDATSPFRAACPSSTIVRSTSASIVSVNSKRESTARKRRGLSLRAFAASRQAWKLATMLKNGTASRGKGRGKGFVSMFYAWIVRVGCCAENWNLIAIMMVIPSKNIIFVFFFYLRRKYKGGSKNITISRDFKKGNIVWIQRIKSWIRWMEIILLNFIGFLLVYTEYYRFECYLQRDNWFSKINWKLMENSLVACEIRIAC